ncbi:cytochrome C assembly family protein [Magnetococcus sp. PR-3]|uniref:cytochrome C assembly family protein n=1 Tax=Magnetococcus sp. PR-3 TaxID=3120355 RepID=UPI002FCE4F45
MPDVLFWLVVIGYAIAAFLVVRNHLRGIKEACLSSWWWATIAWFVQSYLVVGTLVAGHGLFSTGLGPSLFSISLVLGGFYLIGWRINRNEARAVGLVLLPVLVLVLLLSKLLGDDGHGTGHIGDPLLVSHLVLSLSAYGLFSIAVVLALLDAWQEHALKKKQFNGLFRVLPSLEKLEQDLFFMVAGGMGLLTLSILTGMVYTHQQLEQWFVINHKVVFTWITWLVFGALLVGHRVYGWRGRRAVRMTVWGYLFLVLAYIGVKFVAEFVLIKAT